MQGRYGCPHCNGTGIIIGDLGIETECSCVREMEEEKNSTSNVSSAPVTPVKPVIFGEMTKEERIEIQRLVPKHRIEDDFSDKHVKIVAAQLCVKLKYNLSSVEDMNLYLSTLNELLTMLRMRQVPNKSYIIGASNGFGKTTFANTAIKIMSANGMKAVPYIGLTELAEKWATHLENIKSRIELKEFKKKDKFIKDDEDEDCDIQVEYDWGDYVNADLAIVNLTSTAEEVMWIETQTLKALLESRDKKGKPTIVFTSESLDWYFNCERISKYMMSHIIEAQANENSRKKNEFGNKNDDVYNVMENRYDKLEHISVFIKPKTS